MPFFKRKKPDVPETENVGKELLLGDNHRWWVLNDYVIRPELLALYDEMEERLAQIFARGALDAGNAELFDGKIETQKMLAQLDLKRQKDMRPEEINNMVAWREDNVTQLRNEKEMYEERMTQNIERLKRFQEQHSITLLGTGREKE